LIFVCLLVGCADSQNTACQQAMDAGAVCTNGSGRLQQMYYYNTVRQSCQSMVYAGCGGNTNRFASLALCQSQCAANRPLTGSGLGVAPSSYTSVPNYESCVGQSQIGGMISVCLPTTRPTSCSSTTWAQLQVSSAPLSSCPNSPSTQTLANYQQCVGQMPTGTLQVCMPRAQPTTCPSSLWAQLQSIGFLNAKCPVGSTTAATSTYSILYHFANYQLCIGQMQVSTSIAVCLPTTQPVGCPLSTWTQLRQITLPACPSTSLATFNYQSVPNYQSCVKQTRMSMCLPAKQPMLCPLSSYTQLQRLLPAIMPMCESDGFFEAVSTVTVANYQQCVGQSRRSSSVCVPSSRPTACPASLWQQLQAYIYDNGIGGALASCS